MKDKSASIIALLVGMAGTALFSKMLYDGRIGPVSFVTLFSVLCFVSIATYGFPRLKQLDLRNLKLTLEKMETVKKEIYAKERDLRNVSMTLNDLILMGSIWLGRLGSEETMELNKNLLLLQTHKLLDQLGSSQSEREHLFRFVKKFEKLDSCDRDAKEREQIWGEYVEMLRAEVNALTKEAAKRAPAP